MDTFKVFENVVPEPEYKGDINKGYYYRGFFKVPITGNYRFTCSSDGHAQMFLNTTPKSKDSSTMQKVCDVGWVDVLKQVY